MAEELRSPVLEVEGLSVCFGTGADTRVVVADVSFAVSEGEMLGVVGGSGSGKTTTLRAVLRRLPEGARLLSGSIRFRGSEVTALEGSALRRVRGEGIGVIVQNPIGALNPLRRVGYQMRRLAREHGRELSEEATMGYLRDTGIADPARVLRAYPHELSGGMAQRVLIAIAVSLEPAVLLADEPTSALDVTIQAQIMELLRGLVTARGMAVVLVTHDIALVAEYCERAMVMERGVVIEHGRSADVIHSPQQPYTQALVDAARPVTLRRRGLEGATQ